MCRENEEDVVTKLMCALRELEKSGLISRAPACMTVRPSFIRKYNGFIVKGIIVFKKSAQYPK